MRPLSPTMANTALGFVSIALWSTTVAVGRSQTEQLGPLTSAALICLLAGVLGSISRWVTGGLWKTVKASSRLYLLGCGGAFILYQASLYLALGLASNRNQVLEVGLINYLWPMLTLLFSVPILKTRATAWAIPGTLLSLAGVWLAATQDRALSWQAFVDNVSHNVTPYLLALVAAITWGMYSNWSRKWARAAEPGAVPLFLLAAGTVLLIGRAFSPEQTRWTVRAGLELVFVAVAANVAYVSWEHAMRKGDMILVASSSYSIPLLSMLVSSLYLGIEVGIRLWAGCILVIAGAVICKLAIRERATS